MMQIRPLRSDDVPAIRAWPVYLQEFSMLDYCLRDGGWLDQYRQVPGAEIFVAEEHGERAGFSILSPDGPGVREFRVALHPEKIGKGFGRTILQLTLAHGFSDLETLAIRLIVRKNNYRAQALYTTAGFVRTGESTEIIQETPVEFFTMQITRDQFRERDRV